MKRSSSNCFEFNGYLILPFSLFTDKEESINFQSFIMSKPKFCQHCNRVCKTQPVVRKRGPADLSPAALREHMTSYDPTRHEEETVFCSEECCEEYESAERSLEGPARSSQGHMEGQSRGGPGQMEGSQQVQIKPEFMVSVL